MRGMSIADNLSRIRTGKRLSQAKLAAKANVSQQLISRLESGVDQTSKKLPDLARALGVSIYDIDENYRIEGTEGLIRSEADIRSFLRRIENLAPDKQEIVFGVIWGFLHPSGAQSGESASHGQSEPSNPRHAKAPSE